MAYTYVVFIPACVKKSCLHRASKTSNVTSYIRTNGGDINPGSKLKILGFHFDQNPNAVAHVTETIINKFYMPSCGHCVSLSAARGMAASDLLNIYYNTVLRSAVEYCSVVYHTLIPKYISDKLERVQVVQAMKIIFGRECSYSCLVENGTIETRAGS